MFVSSLWQNKAYACLPKQNIWQLTLLLPQNVDRFALTLDPVTLPIGFPAPDSNSGMGKGCAGSIEDRISPIDR